MKNHEVLILGAGPAGLSAAMSLGRMGRSVLVCDDDRPRNAAAEHMNNFVS
ncbi:MAG: FAD-binding protein, partial [Proteobacteria bacterium]